MWHQFTYCVLSDGFHYKKGYFLLLDECLNDLYNTTGNQSMVTIAPLITMGINHIMSFIDNLFFFTFTKYSSFKWENQYLPWK